MLIMVVIISVRADEAEDRILDMEKKIKTLQDRVNRGLGDDAPEGLVAFFEREKCPNGWTFEDRSIGRVLIGRNQTHHQTQDVDGGNMPDAEHSYTLLSGVEGCV